MGVVKGDSVEDDGSLRSKRRKVQSAETNFRRGDKEGDYQGGLEEGDRVAQHV